MRRRCRNLIVLFASLAMAGLAYAAVYLAMHPARFPSAASCATSWRPPPAPRPQQYPRY